MFPIRYRFCRVPIHHRVRRVPRRDPIQIDKDKGCPVRKRISVYRARTGLCRYPSGNCPDILSRCPALPSEFAHDCLPAWLKTDHARWTDGPPRRDSPRKLSQRQLILRHMCRKFLILYRDCKIFCAVAQLFRCTALPSANNCPIPVRFAIASIKGARTSAFPKCNDKPPVSSL